MPELPEVETVKETLKRKILNKKIIDALILYPKIIEYPTTDLFKKQIINQTINDIQRRGKWLMFVLDDYYLFSHLRMEGKYNLKNKNEILSDTVNDEDIAAIISKWMKIPVLNG